MARSPFTLAASVTSAVPNVSVTGVAPLSEGGAERFDSALVSLEDGRRVVIRVPNDEDAQEELDAEKRALSALSAGVRALLPFQAPRLLGQALLGTARAMVFDYLPGYRIDPAHIPAGRGAATSLGEAFAAVHSLPLSVIRDEGLETTQPQQVRAELAELVDQVDATGQIPVALIARWRRALAAERLWQFEPTAILGGVDSSTFLCEDIGDEPRVSGSLGWRGLTGGDPAADLHWLATAPDAADDILRAYIAKCVRVPDALLRERARFYAELEFARWLMHGHATGNREIIADAVGLLEALSDGVSGDDLAAENPVDIHEALAAFDRVPTSADRDVDTSMHTDAYDPSELSLWEQDIANQRERARTEDTRQSAREARAEEVARRAMVDLSDTVPINPALADQLTDDYRDRLGADDLDTDRRDAEDAEFARETGLGGEFDSWAEPGPDAQLDAHPDPEPSVDARTSVDTEARVDAGTSVDTEAGVDTGTGAGAEPERDADSEPFTLSAPGEADQDQDALDDDPRRASREALRRWTNRN